MRGLMTVLTVMTFLVVGLTIGATGAYAQNKEDFTVQYRVYAGGFKALDADVSFNLTPTHYTSQMKAKPYGLIGRLLPWAGEYLSKGTIRNNNFIPDSHSKISQWRDDNDQYLITYQNGLVTKQVKTSIEDGKKTVQVQKPDPALYTGAIDLVTALTEVVVKTAQNKNCTMEPDIYDGKRRFHLQFTDRGTERLTKTGYNAYSGVAHICEVEMEPLKGYGKKPTGYYKIQEEARKRGQLPRVWLAPLWTDGPMVPVKILVKSEYGAVFIHMQKVTRR